MLKSGVVVVGQKPSSDGLAIVSYDTHGLSQLKTVFNFTTKESGYQAVQNFIGTIPADANSVGIAWVNLQNAYVYFGFDATKWAESYAVAGTNKSAWLAGRQILSWNNRQPDGTFVLDPFAGDGFEGATSSGDVLLGSKRFVFGCRLDNAYIQNYVLNSGNCASFSADDESYRFGGVISVYGSHIFVGNNALPQVSEDRKNDRLCIDVNKQQLAFYHNRCAVKSKTGYYAEDVVVRDNWVHNKGNKNYEIAGSWVTVRDNVAHKNFLDERVFFRTCQAGPKKTNEDYMNRGYDFGGFNLWAHSNIVRETGSLGNDGEGMLVQRHNEVETFSHAYTANEARAKQPGQAADKGYIAPYDTHVGGLLLFKNKTSGSIGIRKVVVRNPAGEITKRNFTQDISVVQNEAANGLTLDEVLDFDSTCSSALPAKPTQVKVEVVQHGTLISWKDNASTEIGFRVDRRIGSGAIETIAYRPRHSQGSNTLKYAPSGGGGGPTDCIIEAGFDFNPQAWADFTAPPGQQLHYRVVALNCDESEAGASDWVTIKGEVSVQAPLKQFNHSSLTLQLSSQALTITGYPAALQDATIRLLDLRGRTVATYHTQHGPTASVQIPLLGVRPGMYLLSLESAQVQFQTKCIMN
jgi:hypothetical protein